ncbi:MAG: biopolymer transporter ExbD [Salinivirgaceae bacterium]
MARQSNQEINAGSMADIAFLLLIFFLVTTTMDTDAGLSRQLPPMPDEEQQEDDNKIKERNLLIVLINKQDRLLVNGEELRVKQLRDRAIEFIENTANQEDLPEKKYEIIKIKNPEYYAGSDVPKKVPHKLFEQRFPEGYPVSKGVISLQNDRGTSYKMYIEVQNELVAAYTEVRNRLSKRMFQKAYEELDDEDKVNAIRAAIPQRISEAEPKNIGN